MAYSVRRVFLQITKTTGIRVDERDFERILREDKWIERCLKLARGSISEAVWHLFAMCEWRRVNGVHKALEGPNLDEYKKVVRAEGNDSTGNPLLVINVTEMDKLITSGFGFPAIDFIIMWIEKLDSLREVKEISVVFYHGDNKYMEKVDLLLELVRKISEGYVEFVSKLYVFEDVLSFDMRVKLELMSRICQVPLRFVDQNNCKELINLDLPSYERDNNYISVPSDTNGKFKDSVQPKSEAASKSSNSKRRRKNKRENKNISENVTKDVKDEVAEEESKEVTKGINEDVAEAESKEVAEDVGEENNKKHTEETIKQVLKRLHELQSEINVVIKEVMNML